MPHPINELMGTGMEQLRDMMDANTVVGDMMVSEDGVIVMPVSKVSIGFVCGGAEYPAVKSIKKAGQELDGQGKEGFPMAGCTAAGMSVTPTAFLSIASGEVKLTPIQYDNTIDRLVQLIPDGFDMLFRFIQGLMDKQESEEQCGGEQ